MSDDEDGGGRRSRRKGKGRRGRRSSQGKEDDDSGDEEKGTAGRKSSAASAPAPAVSMSSPAESKKPESKKPESKSETKGGGGDDLTNIDAQSRLYDEINANIETIKDNTRKLRKLVRVVLRVCTCSLISCFCPQDTNNSDERARAKMMKQLDQLVDSSTKKGNEVKVQLERIRSSECQPIVLWFPQRCCACREYREQVKGRQRSP